MIVPHLAQLPTVAHIHREYPSFAKAENSFLFRLKISFLNSRSRPTLKPAGSIVSKAQEFVDIYRNPPSRPDPLYPQPIPDKTAAKCRKDVCLLPDCSCGGKEIPGNVSLINFFTKSV